jgi:SMC interacting uncharacterized protein involved in chromosome segregation
MPHPAQVRLLRLKRAAVRAALDGLRLTPDQLKSVMAEHAELTAKLARLTAENNQVADRTRSATDDRAYASAGKQLDEINRQCDSLLDRTRRLRAHPQVRAVILAKEAKSELVS